MPFWGNIPRTGRNIRLKTGRFGAYLQLGEDGEEGTTTHSLPREKAAMKEIEMFTGDEEDAERNGSSTKSNMIGLSLEEAIGYVGLPRTVSTLNDLPILAGIGPYGPYLKYNNTYASLKKSDGDILTIGPEAAEVLVTDFIINKSSKLGRGVLAELGEKDGSPVTVKSGRFGAYLNWKRVNAKLPAEYVEEPESTPLEEAWSLIQEKAESLPKGGKASKSKSKSSITPNLPPPPKRPLSAYLHFCAAKRPEVAQSVKTLGEVSKKLAALWAETSAEDRKEYEEMAAVGKEEYEKKKRLWEGECEQLVGKTKTGKNAGKSKASKADVDKPKRPKSAYLFFCAAQRPEVTETVKSLGEISKELARRWAETSDRTEFELLAEGDKKRYEEEMSKYSGRNGAKKPTGGKKMLNGKTSMKTSPPPKSPKAPSAYMLFCREFRPTIVDDAGEKLPFGETAKRLAAKWRECDEETKAKFQALAAEEKEKILASV